MNNKTTAIFCLTLLGLTGCRNDVVPCTDCDANQDDDAPLPDLPCGGADLMTDNLNCGSCGSECALMYEGTPYEAGTCKMGECGPLWADCLPELPMFVTCADVCAGYDLSCVGCSMVFRSMAAADPTMVRRQRSSPKAATSRSHG